MLKKILLACLLIFTVLLNSCSVEPTPINYGKDACNFCKMTIVDRQHGAEIVTKKGKVFKYDAIECMMQDLNNMEEDKIAFFMVNTYDQPTKLFDATQVTYMKSEAIPSPMGAFLTAFTTREEALKIKKLKGGDIFDWNELRQKYTKK